VPETPWAQGGPGVTPGTCGAGGERAQLILVLVRALDANEDALWAKHIHENGWGDEPLAIYPKECPPPLHNGVPHQLALYGQGGCGGQHVGHDFGHNGVDGHLTLE